VGGEWRYKSGEQGRGATGALPATKIRQGYALLFPSLPILLRLLGVFVFGSDHDFTNSSFCSNYWVYMCMCTPMSYAGSAPNGYDDTCVTHVSTYPLTLVFGRKKTYTPMSCAGQPVLCSSVFAVLL
jgi:hypothetical protein